VTSCPTTYRSLSTHTSAKDPSKASTTNIFPRNQITLLTRTTPQLINLRKTLTSTRRRKNVKTERKTKTTTLI